MRLLAALGDVAANDQADKTHAEQGAIGRLGDRDAARLRHGWRYRQQGYEEGSSDTKHSASDLG